VVQPSHSLGASGPVFSSKAARARRYPVNGRWLRRRSFSNARAGGTPRPPFSFRYNFHIQYRPIVLEEQERAFLVHSAGHADSGAKPSGCAAIVVAPGRKSALPLERVPIQLTAASTSIHGGQKVHMARNRHCGMPHRGGERERQAPFSSRRCATDVASICRQH